MKPAAFLISALLVGALSCSGQKVFTLPNTSMEPTIRKGEKFKVEIVPFEPARGDLIVFEHDGLMLAKRVIAVGGDTIEGHDDQVLLNGSARTEPYVQHIGLPHSPLSTFGPVQVPIGKVFVAGDNRDYSLDSRTAAFGLVSTSNIKGKPVEIIVSDDPKRVHLLLSSNGSR